MKRIYFDNTRSWFLIIIVVLSLVCISVGLFVFPFVNSKILAFGFLLQGVYFTRMFWHKNYVQWNNRGVVIRIKSFFGKRFTFSEVQSINLNENIFTITKKNGEIISFDLNGFVESDIQKLVKIFERRIPSNLNYKI